MAIYLSYLFFHSVRQIYKKLSLVSISKQNSGGGYDSSDRIKAPSPGREGTFSLREISKQLFHHGGLACSRRCENTASSTVHHLRKKKSLKRDGLQQIILA
jgi:hypothetical protein